MDTAEFDEIRISLRKIREIVNRRAIHMRVATCSEEPAQGESRKYIYDVEMNDAPPPPEQRTDPWPGAIKFSFDFPEIEQAYKIIIFISLILTYDGIDVYVDRELFDPDAVAKKMMEEETNA